ncbi:MAG: hypothetical protein QOE30_175 [Mycobacterium sp.]|jgi:hypothetical protein|uniref:hypothetical protein n=1 Tax=Mycobacterium sp. TaxID=1785 RepID=UPI0028B50063|nr:hypothetical protein [Mycobacterium sp.]MDT5114436.1 hypothetical protein [Mycobacterium sp.]
MVDRRYRTGTSSIDLPNTLRQDELRERIREAIIAEFSDTGEWLSQFDFGPWRLHLGSSASHCCGIRCRLMKLVRGPLEIRVSLEVSRQRIP